MSEEIVQSKKIHKEQRKRSSQTEVYHLPKEIFVFGETTATTSPLKIVSDKKQMQMPAVVLVKDESRHDDDHDLNEDVDHERRSHPKSPRPSYRGRKFTFEGISSVGTKSLQSGEVEHATESYEPRIFTEKISLVYEENSTIESINSTGNERDLLTPASNVYTGTDYNSQMNVSDDAEANRRREELLCALPTPHISNPDLSGERTGGDTGAVHLTPLSPNFLNPFPFDEAATVQAGRLSSQNLADQEDENYYSEPKPVSSDEGDPDWFIEFQVKNGIIAENSGPDDESVTIGDCNATFKEMCGIAVPVDNQNGTITKSNSGVLGDHLKESGVGLIDSHHETTDVVTKSNESNDGTALVDMELAVSAPKAKRQARRRGSHLDSTPSGDKMQTTELPNFLPELALEGTDSPPAMIEIHFDESSPKINRRRSKAMRTAANAATNEELVSVEESHATGHSDITASSRSINTGNFRKVWEDTIPILEAAPSDEEMVVRTKSQKTAAEEKETSNADKTISQDPETQVDYQQTGCQPEPNQDSSDGAFETDHNAPPIETIPESQNTEPVTEDEVICRQTLEFKKSLARRFVRQAAPTGYSQAYLKSSTDEIKTSICKPQGTSEDVNGIIEPNHVSNSISSRGGTNYDLESRRHYGIARKLQYVRPVKKAMVPPAKFPPTVQDNNSSLASRIFGCTKASESPEVGSNPVHEDDKVNTACLLDNDDTRSISPAPSDEFEQRVAYTGCDMSKLGSIEWGQEDLVAEAATNITVFQADESNAVVVSGQTATPANEPEMVVLESCKLRSNERDVVERDIKAPASDDDSILVTEQRDDADETSGGNKEDWMDQIGTIMCAK